MYALAVSRPPTRHRSAGFTLLEVLIAIVIFSIGLLGIAGLQVAGMRFTHGSQLRAVATMQAENLVDRMRANMRGVGDGLYNITGTMPSTYPIDCDAAQCTYAQLATFDLAAWNTTPANSAKARESNADVLPGGAGVVCLDSTPTDGCPSDWKCDNVGVIYAIKVTWTERSSGKDDVDSGAQCGGDSDTGTKRLVMRVIP